MLQTLTLVKHFFVRLFLIIFSLLGSYGSAQIKAIYSSVGGQLKLSELPHSNIQLLPSVFFKGTHLFNHRRHFIFPNLTVGNSISPTLAFTGDKNKGGVILGAEVPISMEVYYGNIESNYFFIGLGLAPCVYILRKQESFFGFGPYFALGGDVPIWRGVFGWKFSFSLFNYEESSLNTSMGIYYQIGYGY